MLLYFILLFLVALISTHDHNKENKTFGCDHNDKYMRILLIIDRHYRGFWYGFLLNGCFNAQQRIHFQE